MAQKTSSTATETLLSITAARPEEPEKVYRSPIKVGDHYWSWCGVTKTKKGSPKNALRSSHVIKWNKKLCNICKFHGIQAISGGALWVCTMHTWQNSTQTKNSGGMCLHYTQAVPLMTETCSPGRAHCFVSLVISPSPSPRDQHIVLFLVISPWKQDTGQ